MNLFKRRAKIEIAASSGILRITVPPRESWFLILVVIAADVVFAVMAYKSWSEMSLSVHIIFVWGIISGTLALVFQLSVTQIIEFDALRLTVCKDIHGWERRQEYQISNCSELEWVPASEGRSAGLQCKIDRRKVIVGEDLSDDEVVEILTALQQKLPGVAQKLCSYPNSKDHFVTLGLGR